MLVACARGTRGKIRVTLKGQQVDMLATTDERQIPVGPEVLVVEVRDDVAHVARACGRHEGRGRRDEIGDWASSWASRRPSVSCCVGAARAVRRDSPSSSPSCAGSSTSAGPTRSLIFAGRKHRLPDGTAVGYKVVRRGWALRMPLLETVSRMDMRLFMVEVAVANAYSKGGIPLDVHAIANVKISSDPAHVRNAVERFLGMSPEQIADGGAADAGGRAARGAGPAHARGGQRGPPEVRRDA